MLTPQEVSGRSFTKAVMGGYNMTMVDEFLDELTADYTALYNENATLKAKMKVLVEKVEEYRATEDSMRATLLTAQRMADTIVREAEEKRDGILAQAESTARERLEVYRREAAACDERVRQGRKELQQFIAASRELCSRELAFLEHLPEIEVETAGEEAAIAEIEERVMTAFSAPAPETPAPAEAPQTPPPAAPQSAAPAAAAPVKEAAPAPAPAAAAASAPAEEVPTPSAAQTPVPAADAADLEATRRINLADLKFGRNYSSEMS
ncbi:MAG: DivIVA domain-containing protein [Oscillibacter sp.]|nr:DivIVA domain-containing protein [Oscillibacter sp.]